MENKETSFSYTYSAAQQREIENIRLSYLPKEENKLAQLRKLHNSATQKAQIWAITVGIIGTLILGAGMSLTMSELGAILGLQGILAMVIGIVIGIVGMILIASAYPIYNRVLQKERRRIAPEILRLSDELLQ